MRQKKSSATKLCYVTLALEIKYGIFQFDDDEKKVGGFSLGDYLRPH